MNITEACGIVEGLAKPPADEEKILEAWQYLVDSGFAWRLQGWYGRTATHLLERGFITSSGGEK